MLKQYERADELDKLAIAYGSTLQRKIAGENLARDISPEGEPLALSRGRL